MSNLHEQGATGAGTGAPANAAGRRRSGTGWIAAAVAVVIAALAAGAALLLSGDDDPFAGEVATDRFQAVVLTNERVYFGRLQGRRGEFFLLTDVYFLRDAPTGGADGDPVRQVVPLTAELHGPEDRMLIHESQLVLVENLAPESPVLETIYDLDRP